MLHELKAQEAAKLEKEQTKERRLERRKKHKEKDGRGTKKEYWEERAAFDNTSIEVETSKGDKA